MWLWRPTRGIPREWRETAGRWRRGDGDSESLDVKTGAGKTSPLADAGVAALKRGGENCSGSKCTSSARWAGVRASTKNGFSGSAVTALCI